MTSRRFSSLEIFEILVAIASLAVPAAGFGADSACVPHTWDLSVVDQDVTDVDSYVAATWIFLNDSGRASIYYAKGPLGFNEWRLKQAVERAGAWRTRRLPANPGDPRLQVAVDSTGTPHLAWRPGVFFGEGILKYAKIVNGEWQEETVDDTLGGTSHVSIAVDAANRPHILYTGELAGMPTRYAHWDGTAWQNEIVDPRTGTMSPSLALDAAGEPRAVFIVGGGSEIDYVTRTGGVWSSEPIDVIPFGRQTLEASLALDSSGQPHVAYDEVYDVGIHYAVKTGGSWSSVVIEPGQRWDPSLVLDSADVPHMVFYGAEEGSLRYASLSSGAWCVETVEDDPSDLIRIGRDPNLVVGEDGRVHVSYYYHDFAAPCQIKHAVSAP